MKRNKSQKPSPSKALPGRRGDKVGKRPIHHKAHPTPYKSKSPAPGICHFLQTWSDELAMDPATLKKSLIRSDYRPEPGVPIPLKVIVGALFGEEHVEKVRGMRLDNDEKERKAKEREGILVEWERVQDWLTRKVFGPMRTAMDAAPKDIDREWVEKSLKPTIRENIEPPKQ